MCFESVLESLHRDLALEQKIDEIIDINGETIVKEICCEIGYPTKNSIEQGGIRILKSMFDVIIDVTRDKPEVWPWVYNYIADVNNYYTNRILSCRTTIENHHGYTPDISTLLLYQFWEPIYFLTDESTPMSREIKGRWMVISHNVGDKLTFYIYCNQTEECFLIVQFRQMILNKMKYIMNILIPHHFATKTTSESVPTVLNEKIQGSLDIKSKD